MNMSIWEWRGGNDPKALTGKVKGPLILSNEILWRRQKLYTSTWSIRHHCAPPLPRAEDAIEFRIWWKVPRIFFRVRSSCRSSWKNTRALSRPCMIEQRCQCNLQIFCREQPEFEGDACMRQFRELNARFVPSLQDISYAYTFPIRILEVWPTSMVAWIYALFKSSFARKLSQFSSDSQRANKQCFRNLGKFWNQKNARNEFQNCHPRCLGLNGFHGLSPARHLWKWKPASSLKSQGQPCKSSYFLILWPVWNICTNT